MILKTTLKDDNSEAVDEAIVTSEEHTDNSFNHEHRQNHKMREKVFDKKNIGGADSHNKSSFNNSRERSVDYGKVTESTEGAKCLQ